MSAWTSEGQPAALGDTTVTLVEGGSFCVCPRNGDILQGGAQSVDSTPLFVMVLGELSRWGVHDEAVQELLPCADAALDWIRSSAAPFQLLRSMLRFDLSISDGYLRLFPAELEGLRIEGLSLVGSNVAIEVGVTGTRVRGLPEGATLIEEPRGPPARAMWPVH